MQRYSYHREKLGKSFDLSRLIRGFKKLDRGTLVKNLILAGIAAVLLGAVVFFLAFLWFSKDLPDPNSLSSRDVPQSTKIFDRTGEHLLYEISAGEKRTLVTIDQIPKTVINATITAEDRSFYEHGGISIKGILRSLFSNAINLDPTGQGASTITQQAVRNAILTTEKTIGRKFKEIILSLAVEKRYSKDEILQLYFNEIGYGSTNYGIESASQAYFKKHVSDVSLAEAATLAAIPNRPTTFLNNPDLLKARRDWILDGMVELDYASQTDVDAAKLEDTSISVSLTGITAPHFVLWVKEQLEEKYTQRTVEEGGLKVTTSLDYDKQKLAETAVNNGVTARGVDYGFNNAGLVSLDPKTGQILAMVGSADYHNDDIQGQVNVTTRPLQPGSSIKPIVYAAAFAKGYTPNTILWDVKTVFPTATGNYAPNNYDGGEHGPVTLRKALQGSLNIPAVKALYLVGIENALQFAEKLGYTTFTDRSKFGLAIVLGGAEVKLLEHANAYATFANNGVKHEMVSILKVEDPKGTVLEEWKAEEQVGEQVVDSNVTATLSNVLSDDASRQYVFGPVNYLQIGRPVAAKTGTTNDYNDAWTMGYTPSLVAGVWVGNTNGAEMKRGADGSKIAAPIWQEYMKTALAGTAVEGFPAAEIPLTGKAILDGQIPTTTFVIDKATGKLATDETPDRMREEKTCGDYHTILTYLDKNDPRGPVPTDPAKDPYYTPWETAIQDYITRHNAALKENEKPYEICTPPTESDDVHTSRNRPKIEIKDPSDNGDVGRAFTVELNASTRRDFSRVEYEVDGSFVASIKSLDGGTITLPGWVGIGSHTLTAIVYDDVDNAASDSITIRVNEAGSNGGFKITNPFNNQEIEKTGAGYTISIEVPDAEGLNYLEVAVTNLWTGATSVAGSTMLPSAITSLTWNLPDEGEYLLIARASTATGATLESTPIKVYVKDAAVTGIPILELVPAL